MTKMESNMEMFTNSRGKFLTSSFVHSKYRSIWSIFFQLATFEYRRVMVAKNVWIFVRGFWVRWGSQTWCPGDMITREGIPENGYIPVKGLNIHSLFCGRRRRRTTTTTTTTTASNLYNQHGCIILPYLITSTKKRWKCIGSGFGAPFILAPTVERLLATTGGNGSILVYFSLSWSWCTQVDFIFAKKLSLPKF